MTAPASRRLAPGFLPLLPLSALLLLLLLLQVEIGSAQPQLVRQERRVGGDHRYHSFQQQHFQAAAPSDFKIGQLFEPQQQDEEVVVEVDERGRVEAVEAVFSPQFTSVEVDVDEVEKDGVTSELSGVKIDVDVEVVSDEEEKEKEKEESNEVTPKRGLVPQLWANYTAPTLPPAENVSCATAHMKCAYRAGCGLALKNYMMGCADLAAGKTDKCNTYCRYSLIALMSTPEGKRLMKCNCQGDAFCLSSKLNVAQCQSEVVHATRPDTVVTCTAAQYICAADPLCSTALDYYNRFCGAMFRGRKCTSRCLNSIRILQRQEAAAKLETCRCDGTENFDCVKVKANMEALCFAKAGDDDGDLFTNEIDGGQRVDDKRRDKSDSAKMRAHKFLLALCVFLSVGLTLVVDAFLRTVQGVGVGVGVGVAWAGEEAAT